MQTAREILNRIRWDRRFAEGADFEVGYYDRVDDVVTRTAFKDILFPRDDRFSFEVVDDDGEIHAIPYHRVREIYRNGRLIWHREQ